MSSEHNLSGGDYLPAASVSPGDSTDPSQKPKRARTSKPKVKTGCNNCKQRRIKCDEKRPACSNCTRSKKAQQRSKAVPEAQHPPQTPNTSHAMIMLRRPPANLPFNDQESLYFQLFREHTANELSGFFDSAFWTRSVLQECHSESSIRHAVVALGALYKTLEKTTESPPGSPSDDRDLSDTAWRHWEMAVKQYSNALTSLVSVSTSDTRSHRTRLMASVLLACFDSFIGDHKQAIRQIQTGLGLLEQLRVERRRAFHPKPEEPVEEELVQMFTRLAIQAKSYDMAFHFPDPWIVRLTTASQNQDPSSPSSEGASPVSLHQDPIPERFGSIIDARLAWDTLCERIFRFTETMFAHAQSGVMGVLPASLRQYGIHFRKDIESWSDAFEHILASRTAPGVSSQEKAGIAVLKMNQIMAQILFLMTFSDSEVQFDSFIVQFKAIVNLALEVVGDEERRAAAKRCPDPAFCRHRHRHEPDIFGGHEYAARHIKASFSADLGIVPPLFVVATKCRNPLIRRQAIQLLRSSSRREGMWDSELTARIGMWIAEIEEQEDAAPAAFASEDAASAVKPEILAPWASPVQSSQSRPSTSGSSNFMAPQINGSNGSIDFGDNALGPGGNARWDARRESQGSAGNMFNARPQQQLQKTIPEDRRVMVRAVEFDLHKRYALIQLGTRGLPTGTPDLKTRSTKIMW
ncbi:hypothetical protein B0T17DRAFT_609846 [Bombardia bombarda]|uniref:Zn(2)-C6 fungal-type domain-containing protein n=1 Tax=Bombardia bombarda TaxID=252184 RepID=A0AA40BWC4_9PEZI|nr:hypothetical protein B0T17DRAFT_609846 [Bombardia bombarda]